MREWECKWKSSKCFQYWNTERSETQTAMTTELETPGAVMVVPVLRVWPWLEWLK